MKRIFKKGFTLVELVIVIAVIAVLAAVLIPTFSDIIEKANNSADLQEARNLFSQALIEDPTITDKEVWIKVGKDNKIGYVKFEKGQPKEVKDQEGKIVSGDYTEDVKPEGMPDDAIIYVVGEVNDPVEHKHSLTNGVCECGAKHYICNNAGCEKDVNKYLTDEEYEALKINVTDYFGCPDCFNNVYMTGGLIIPCEPGCAICGKTSNTEHTHTYSYTNNGETHTITCSECEEVIEENVAHDYNSGEAGKCICGAEETSVDYDIPDDATYVTTAEELKNALDNTECTYIVFSNDIGSKDTPSSIEYTINRDVTINMNRFTLNYSQIESKSYYLTHLFTIKESNQFILMNGSVNYTAIRNKTNRTSYAYTIKAENGSNVTLKSININQSTPEASAETTGTNYFVEMYANSNVTLDNSIVNLHNQCSNISSVAIFGVVVKEAGTCSFIIQNKSEFNIIGDSYASAAIVRCKDATYKLEFVSKNSTIDSHLNSTVFSGNGMLDATISSTDIYTIDAEVKGVNGTWENTAADEINNNIFGPCVIYVCVKGQSCPEHRVLEKNYNPGELIYCPSCSNSYMALKESREGTKGFKCTDWASCDNTEIIFYYTDELLENLHNANKGFVKKVNDTYTPYCLVTGCRASSKDPSNRLMKAAN